MFADTPQTSTLEVARRTGSVRLGKIVGSLIVGSVIVSLLVGLIWGDRLVRYPGVNRQATQYQVRFQYQTSDDLPKVLRWYVQRFGLSHEVPQGDNCVMVTGENTFLFLQQSLAVTLCAQQRRTLIFVNRSIALR